MVTEREAWIERRSKREKGRGNDGGRETGSRFCWRRERRREKIWESLKRLMVFLF